MDSVVGGPRVNVEVEDDIWGGDDGDLEHYFPTDTDLQREWEARRNQFHTLGYRDGISAGKESEAQVGFNIGFKEAVVAGYSWGVARGAASAFSALTPALKELLLNGDAAKRLDSLNSSISSISSDEAMRLFYDESILHKGTTVSEEGLQTVAAVETNSSVTTPESESEPNDLCAESGDYNQQRLSLELDTDDKPITSSETFDAGGSSSGSPVVSLSTDAETISDVGYSDEDRRALPDVALAVDAGTSDVNRSSRTCTRLELLQGKVEMEFKSSIVKLTAFPS